jgi:hypothetical protein
MIHLLLFAVACAAFAALCLARPRHQRDLLGRSLGDRSTRALGAAGGALLASGFAAAGLTLGWGYGLVEWLGQAGVGAALIVLFLHYRTRLPRKHRPQGDKR